MPGGRQIGLEVRTEKREYYVADGATKAALAN
jgi:hypothetical protein